MAVTLDNNSSQQEVFSAGTNVTWTFAYTVSGSLGYLLVKITVRDGFHSASIVSAVTYAGVSMARLGQEFYGTNSWTVDVWGLAAPASGSNNVVITFGGTTGGGDVVVGVDSFNGVDQATPVGTVVTAKWTGSFIPSVTLTSAVGGMCSDVVCTQNSAAITSTGSGQTQEYSVAQGVERGAGSYSAGASSVTMSWTTVSPNGWCQAGVPLNAAATDDLATKMVDPRGLALGYLQIGGG